MKFWHINLKKELENPKVNVFIQDIIKVYKKHGLAISHEDIHGSFEIVKLHKAYIAWLKNASVDTK